MKAINHKYYGDDVRWFLGTVVDNSPPAGLEGRIRIRIYGVHNESVNEIPQADLPWAQVMTPSDTFGVSGYGTSCSILPGALVFGIFLDGIGSQLPLVLGSLPRIEYPTNVQAAGRDDIATNPFSLVFTQSNADAIDPIEIFEGPLADKLTAAYFFIDNGYNAKEASSIVGVLEAASKLETGQYGDNFGIAAWNVFSDRWKRFSAYTARLEPAKKLTDFDAQLIYVLQELKTTHTIAHSKLKAAKEITGSLSGVRVDGITTKTNGQVAALIKYYISNSIEVSQSLAEGIANRIYNSLGAR